MERKRLYRNVNDKMLCGVCSGLADYFNIYPTLVRLAWVLLGFMGGSGNIEKFTHETGPAIAKRLKDEGVDAVLMTAG